MATTALHCGFPSPDDGEVLGLCPDTGLLIQWDAAGDTTGEPGPYLSETLAEFGPDNLFPHEAERIAAVA